MLSLNYQYRKTKKIKKLLHDLEVLKKAYELLPEFPLIEKNLRRQSFLKSALYSAKIEGNKLDMKDVADLGNKRPVSLAKKEVFNLLQAVNWINSSKAPKTLNLDVIKKLHGLVLNGISSDAGKFRIEQSAVFSSEGVAVYVAPPVNQLKDLMKNYVRIINSSKYPFPALAAIAHFAFEKIHPFLDGNGRVGRLASSLILKNKGYDFRCLSSFEHYLNNHRQNYYDLLTVNKKDITQFVEFFLQGLIFEAKQGLNKFSQEPTPGKEEQLLPRRREILEIIRDHGMVSFDFIRRRFLVVPESSLHYDLSQLVKKGFVVKLGSTRGVVYRTSDL